MKNTGGWSWDKGTSHTSKNNWWSRQMTQNRDGSISKIMYILTRTSKDPGGGARKGRHCKLLGNDQYRNPTYTHSDLKGIRLAWSGWMEAHYSKRSMMPMQMMQTLGLNSWTVYSGKGTIPFYRLQQEPYNGQIYRMTLLYPQDFQNVRSKSRHWL